MYLTTFQIFLLSIGFLILLYIGFVRKQKLSFQIEQIHTLQLDLEKQKNEINLIAQIRFEEFKANEIEFLKKEIKEVSVKEAQVMLDEWKIQNETFYRQDAINRSSAVILGKVTEHAIPFHAQFPFNPKDARFIGSPIDMIVFDGAEAEEVVDIYILEIKTGESKLNKRQRLVKEAVLKGRVHWRELRI